MIVNVDGEAKEEAENRTNYGIDTSLVSRQLEN